MVNRHTVHGDTANGGTFRIAAMSLLLVGQNQPACHYGVPHPGGAMAGWAICGRRVWLAVSTCLVGLAALVAVASLGVRAPAGPAAPDVRAPVHVLQMNLCDSGLADCYTGRSVGEAAAVIRAVAPDLVTVNEVCRDDLATLQQAVGALNSAHLMRPGHIRV